MDMKQKLLDAFQFHSGSIKSLSSFEELMVLPWFQFHSGSIKRKKKVKSRAEKKKFQFHSGSIKSRGWMSRLTIRFSVSIP